MECFYVNYSLILIASNMFPCLYLKFYWNSYRRTKLHILGYGVRASKICQGFESNCAKVHNLSILQNSLDLQQSYLLILFQNHQSSEFVSFNRLLFGYLIGIWWKNSIAPCLSFMNTYDITILIPGFKIVEIPSSPKRC